MYPNPDGWYQSINDRGAILVTSQEDTLAGTTDPDYEERGLLINTTTADPDSGRWTATWIPVVPTPWNPDVMPKTCYGRDINNNGDVVGV